MAGIAPLGQRLLDVLFPPRCVGCGAGGAVLCRACRATVRPVTPPLCARCGEPLVETARVSSVICAACASGGFPAALAGIRVAAHYDGPLRKAIQALKFNGQRRLAEPLGDLLVDALRHAGWPLEVLVPVPLHPTRVRERGYNQATLLARRCGARVGASVREDALIRGRATTAQTRLSAAERRTNLVGAFALAGRGAADLAGKHITLVDDVTTTGSTLAAAAEALAALHPAAVWGLAVARPDLRHGGDDASGRGR